ncbi:MAG: hypothetical protein LBT04_03000 [Prevotellaceae bacterium]|jgi:hypothetical protein|nr:hypothetical protein [Prevotellaceae bacterium]
MNSLRDFRITLFFSMLLALLFVLFMMSCVSKKTVQTTSEHQIITSTIETTKIDSLKEIIVLYEKKILSLHNKIFDTEDIFIKKQFFDTVQRLTQQTEVTVSKTKTTDNSLNTDTEIYQVDTVRQIKRENEQAQTTQNIDKQSVTNTRVGLSGMQKYFIISSVILHIISVLSIIIYVIYKLR